MPFNDARAGWIVAGVTLCVALLGGLVTASAQSGAIETRVRQLESKQATIDGKIDSIAAAVARIEGKLEAHRQ